jgi:hypothetical protein
MAKKMTGRYNMPRNNKRMICASDALIDDELNFTRNHA